jgi:hypothetical protein
MSRSLQIPSAGLPTSIISPSAVAPAEVPAMIPPCL